MVIDDAVSRRAARMRRLHRALAVFCLAGACAAAVLALRPPVAESVNPASVRIDADTRFDFIAVFAPDANDAEVERWRTAVLRVHRTPCLSRLPCTARALRFADLGPARRYALAFDLNPAIAADERAALLAVANAEPARVRLIAASTPRRAAGG